MGDRQLGGCNILRSRRARSPRLRQVSDHGRRQGLARSRVQRPRILLAIHLRDGVAEMLSRVFSLLLIMTAACSEATVDDVRPAPPSYDGKNRVLSFDGLNDYATTGTAGFPIAYGPQTLMLWARPARVV